MGEPDLDADDYWRRVGMNLQARRLRLIFVADEITLELRHIVEYLNAEIANTDALPRAPGRLDSSRPHG